MIPTIRNFLDLRTVPGDRVPLYVLRSACNTWARNRRGPFVEVGVLEDVVRQRGARIVIRRSDGEPLVIGIRLLPRDAPDNIVPDIAGAAAAMRVMAEVAR
ncbi:hypothetical protein ACFUIW_10980 [Streptomyces sp. NPDC057245]|uniref:hypothetical protein n=1 Tax=Streptomyces sp. NPDC057245 TaxID=3346065 RepID=UPI00363848C9